MSGKRKKYDANKIMKEIMAIVTDTYRETGELTLTAAEMSMSPLKVRKLLMTAGEYHSEISDEINKMFSDGRNVQEIQRITGLGKSSVNGYLPYVKTVYKSKELS